MSRHCKFGQSLRIHDGHLPLPCLLAVAKTSCQAPAQQLEFALSSQDSCDKLERDSLVGKWPRICLLSAGMRRARHFCSDLDITVDTGVKAVH